jgi:hypothetical protein
MLFIDDKQWYNLNYVRESKTMDDNLKSIATLFKNADNFMRQYLKWKINHTIEIFCFVKCHFKFR